MQLRQGPVGGESGSAGAEVASSATPHCSARAGGGAPKQRGAPGGGTDREAAGRSGPPRPAAACQGRALRPRAGARSLDAELVGGAPLHSVLLERAVVRRGVVQAALIGQAVLTHVLQHVDDVAAWGGAPRARAVARCAGVLGAADGAGQGSRGLLVGPTCRGAKRRGMMAADRGHMRSRTHAHGHARLARPRTVAAVAHLMECGAVEQRLAAQHDVRGGVTRLQLADLGASGRGVT